MGKVIPLQEDLEFAKRQMARGIDTCLNVWNPPILPSGELYLAVLEDALNGLPTASGRTTEHQAAAEKATASKAPTPANMDDRTERLLSVPGLVRSDSTDQSRYGMG